VFKYLKYYMEPSAKEVREKAYSSAIEYYREKPFNSYDLRTREFQAYQMGFVRAYRRAYAQSKLSQNLAQ
jgi:hypothetical protein